MSKVKALGCWCQQSHHLNVSSIDCRKCGDMDLNLSADIVNIYFLCCREQNTKLLFAFASPLALCKVGGVDKR